MIKISPGHQIMIPSVCSCRDWIEINRRTKLVRCRFSAWCLRWQALSKCVTSLTRRSSTTWSSDATTASQALCYLSAASSSPPTIWSVSMIGAMWTWNSKKLSFRRPYQLHQWWCRADARDKHLLLDHVHVYVTRSAWEGSGNGSRQLGTWKRIRQWQNVPQLLPVGAFHPLLPGKSRKRNTWLHG